MIQAKLFVLSQEIELLWTDILYSREIRLNGKPSTEIISGLITLCFATGKDSDLILRWMTKENEDNTWQEIDKMEKGKICFYEKGFDYPPSKTYEFNDVHLIYFKEKFSNEGEEPMQTIITISPAIQNYGAQFIKRWNVSWIPPNEIIPYQAIENNTEPKFIKYHFENKKGEIIEVKNIKINQDIKLVITTVNANGTTIKINLNNSRLDFIHNGKVLENDILKGVKINDEETRVPLTATKQ